MVDNFDVLLVMLIDKEVSFYYLIFEQFLCYQYKLWIWQLVLEEDLVWYVGVSYWCGSMCINDIFIGIELENCGWQKMVGVKSFIFFYLEQIVVLILLVCDIIVCYYIVLQNVVVYVDIVLQCKDDLGLLFFW